MHENFWCSLEYCKNVVRNVTSNYEALILDSRIQKLPESTLNISVDLAAVCWTLCLACHDRYVQRPRQKMFYFVFIVLLIYY